MSAVKANSLYDNMFLQLGIGLLTALLIVYMQFKLEPVLLLGVTFAPLVLIIAFRKPYITAILFMGFSFFRIHEAYPVVKPLKLILFTSLLSLLVLAWHAFLARTIKPVWTRELTWLLVFFGLVTLAIPFSFDPDVALKYWQTVYVKIIIMVPAIAWLIRSASDFNWTNRIIITGGVLIALRAIYNKHYGIGLVEGTRVSIGRPVVESPFNLEDPFLPKNYLFSGNDAIAVLADPNDLALVLLFPLGFAAAFLVYRSGKLNLLFGLLGVPLISMGIIATQSRGGLLGMLAALGIIGLRLIKSKVALGLLGGIAFVGLFLAMGIGDRSSGGFAELSKTGGIDESSMGRIIAWQAALNMAFSHPLNGVGLNNFVEAFSTYTLSWPGMNKAVHSTWFGVLAETGLPGIIAFVTMLTLTIKTAVGDLFSIADSDAPNEVKAAALAQVAGLASFCTAGTFLTQGFTWPIYILIALTIAIHQYAATELPGKGRDDLTCRAIA